MKLRYMSLVPGVCQKVGSELARGAQESDWLARPADLEFQA